MPRGCVVSKEPYVVISSINHDAPLGIISLLPDYFKGKKSLHLLSPSWSLRNQFNILARRIEEAKKEFPAAEFVILANEEFELINLQFHGLLCVPGNASIFIDEDIFKPTLNATKKFDALYNALFKKFKNHALCGEISSLALIYYRYGNENANDIEYENDTKKRLAHAEFLNESQHNGFKYLALNEVAAMINQSHVGLCLSDVEGTMRACVEYLLCGIPVVSIPAVGGRMRYLNDSNSRLVPANAKSVAQAVQDLKECAIDPNQIRNDILSILRFERQCFEDSVSLLAKKVFGVEHLFLDSKPFKNSINYLKLEQWKRVLSD
jgi:Glycosyl transferases group 1